MLLQVEGHERNKFDRYFKAMFRQRKQIFYDQKKWDVNIVDGCYEVDEFDRDDTCYLLALSDTNELVGSVRLISTVMPHMLSGPFQTMFPDIGFQSPLIWEATRFAVLPEASTQLNHCSFAARELMLGVVQFGLNNGVKNILGVYDAAMARHYRRCGFTTIELSRFRTAQHGTIYAGLCPISKALESSVLAATGLDSLNAATLPARAA